VEQWELGSAKPYTTWVLPCQEVVFANGLMSPPAMRITRSAKVCGSTIAAGREAILPSRIEERGGD